LGVIGGDHYRRGNTLRPTARSPWGGLASVFWTVRATEGPSGQEQSAQSITCASGTAKEWNSRTMAADVILQVARLPLPNARFRRIVLNRLSHMEGGWRAQPIELLKSLHQWVEAHGRLRNIICWPDRLN
jgi:hypothetical protein